VPDASCEDVRHITLELNGATQKPQGFLGIIDIESSLEFVKYGDKRFLGRKLFYEGDNSGD